MRRCSRCAASSVKGFSGMRVSAAISSSLSGVSASLATPQCSPRLCASQAARRARRAGSCAWMAGMPRPATSPVALGLAAFRLWRRLPPAQRRMLLEVARTHGPRVAAARRRRGERACPPPGALTRLSSSSATPSACPHDAVLLALVRRRVALARARLPRAADVAEPSAGARADRLLEAVADRPPGPHVLRLLLRPDDLAKPRVATRRAPRARRRGTGRAARCGRPRRRRRRARLVADDVVVELARAEHEPLDRVVVGRRVVEHGAGTAHRQSSSSADDACLRRSSPFGVISDQRARRGVERLPAEQVEVLGRRRAVRDADVLLRAELEEALEPRARVLRAVPLVAVRQQQRQPRGLLPLRAARDDELVDDDLRAVDEVAELRLPEDERVRGRDRVAVLEAERRVLRERRVVDLERGVRPGQVLDRGDGLAGARVVEHEVAVRERAALGVLAREADRDPVLEQRRERERLRLAPVDPAVGRSSRGAARAGARASGSP